MAGKNNRRRGSELLEVVPESRRIEHQEPPQPEAPQLDENIARFLIERGQGIADAVVKVYKVGGQHSAGGRSTTPSVRDAFLYQCSPEEFSEEILQASYGEGAYRVRLYGTNSEGDYGLIANQLLEVGPAPKFKQVNGALASAAPPAAPVAVAQVDTARAVAEALAPILAAQTTLLGQLAQGAQGGGSRRAMLEEMEMMARMFKPAAAPDPLGGVAGLQAVLSIAEKFKGNGGVDASDPDAAPYSAIIKALDVFGNMMAARNTQPPQPALPNPNAAPAAAADAAPASQPAQEETEMNMIARAALAGQLLMLLNAAKGDSDPELYATLIYEQAPDEVLDKLEGENWFADLCELQPGFSAYKPWAEKVRTLVVQAIKEDEAGTDLTEGPANGTTAADEAAGNGPAK